jgi:hypothetical protein
MVAPDASSGACVAWHQIQAVSVEPAPEAGIYFRKPALS